MTKPIELTENTREIENKFEPNILQLKIALSCFECEWMQVYALN